MNILYFKALHIIFVVSWFAGLFYNVRLFIYHVEASNKSEPEKSILIKQYKIMSSRLWKIITWPASVLALIFGLGMIHLYTDDLPIWLIIKLVLVAGLFVYQIFSYRIHQQLKNDIVKYTSTYLRIWNEIATLFLFSIVFLVVLKNTMDMIWGTIGLFGLAIVLMVAIKLYKKNRKQ
jgi:putative membrane protein